MHWNHSVRWLLPVKLWRMPCISNPSILKCCNFEVLPDFYVLSGPKERSALESLSDMAIASQTVENAMHFQSLDFEEEGSCHPCHPCKSFPVVGCCLFKCCQDQRRGVHWNHSVTWLSLLSSAFAVSSHLPALLLSSVSSSCASCAGQQSTNSQWRCRRRRRRRRSGGPWSDVVDCCLTGFYGTLAVVVVVVVVVVVIAKK